MFAKHLMRCIRIKSCQKLSNEHVGSRILSGNKFQDIRPATEKARRPNIKRWWRGMNDWW